MYYRGLAVCLVVAIGLTLEAEGTPLKKSNLPYGLDAWEMMKLMDLLDKRYAKKDEMAKRKCQTGVFGCTGGCNGRDDKSDDLRYTYHTVKFDEAFKEIPTVMVAMKRLVKEGSDVYRGYDMWAKDIKTNQFTGVIEIIDTTKILEIEVAYIACTLD